MANGALTILDGTADSRGTQVVLPDGSRVERIITIYEDKEANIWLSTPDRNLYVSRTRDWTVPQFEIVARDIGATLILRDSRGIAWLASNSFLARLVDGRVEEIKNIGVERIQPRSLFEDSKGRIWIGTRFNGVVYTDEPGASAPTFHNISSAD